MKKYIAYVSNLNVDQMKRRCPGARVYDTGNLKGYKHEFRGHGTCCIGYDYFNFKCAPLYRAVARAVKK